MPDTAWARHNLQALFYSHDPVGVEGNSCVGGTHIHFSGRGAGLPFFVNRLSFRRQLLCGCLLTISTCLVILLLDDAGPVHCFSVSLEVIEGDCPELLGFPFFQVFLGELVPYVEPQGGVCSHIVPPKLCAVGHPHINVPDEGVGQIARLLKVAPIQMASIVILPKLQEHGHPGPHRWAAHTNIFIVGAQRNQWQFPSHGHRCLDVFQCA